jgi:TP901 family phage tail tape measure protein
MAGPTYGQGFVDLTPRMTDKALSGFSSGFAGKMGPIATVAGGVLVAGIGVAIAGGVAALKIGETFDDAFDTIRVGTGATGETLEALKGEFKDVFSGVPTDAASASQAVADLNTRLGLTGDELEDRASQFLELSRITGTDLTGNIETATRVFGDWGVAVGDQEGTLDAMFRASQATGIGVDTLGSQLVKFGAPLRQLGFGFSESAALLGQFEKEGVNAELVMGSMRIALGKMARDGEDAEDTFRRVTGEIANAGSTSEANALALELFGARAGPDMAAAIREGRFEVDELMGSIADGEETIRGAAKDTNDWRQSLTILKNRALVAIEPLATRVFQGFGTLIERVTPHVEKFLGFLTGLFETLSSVFSGDGITAGPLTGVVSSVGEVFGRVAELIKVIWDGLVAFWDEWGETIIGVLTAVWDTISGVIGGALDVIVGIFDVVFGILTGDWTRVWEGIKGILGGVWDAIVAILTGAWDIIKTLFSGALGAVSQTITDGFGSIVGWFRDLPGRIVSVLGNLGQLLVDAGKAIIRGLWNGIKSMGSWLAEQVGGFIRDKIPGPIKSVLGISSPSKVAAGLGESIIEGLAFGMSKDLRLIETAATSLAGAAVPPLSPIRTSVISGAMPRGFDDETVRGGLAFGDINVYGVTEPVTENGVARALEAAVSPYINL